ncbi:major facilitator superfamily domain-containing protein [Aspergillus venezuelensis]
MAESKRSSAMDANQIEPIAPSARPHDESKDEEQTPPLPMDVEESVICSKTRRSAILMALYLVMFITALDQTIVATSIPSISSSLHSAAGYTWIGSAYLLSTAASGPIWVRGSDIFGRKPALLGSVTVFAVGSIVAATASTMRALIAARALQGLGAGGVNQLVYVTISDLFSMRERALWFGCLGGIWAVAGSAGPVLGGALTEKVSWRWCFWINLPVCGAALALLLACLDVHNPRTKLSEGARAIDWLGTVTIVGLTVMGLLGMEFGGTTFPWDSPTVICLIGFGGVMVGIFVLVEKRFARFPLIPMGLFGNWFVVAAFVLAFAHAMVSFGIEYYLPLYFQSVKQASPLRSGLYILPVMVTEAATDILAGVFLHRVGRYGEITWVGTVLMALGTGLLVSLTVTSSIGKTIGFAIVGGIGTALLFQTPVIAVQNSVEKKANTAAATATLGFMRNIATSFSIVLGGVVFRDSMERQQDMLRALGVDSDIVRNLAGDMAAANVEIVKQIADPGQRQAAQGAFAWSLRNMFIFYTALCGVAVVAGCFVRQKPMSSEHTETRTGVKELEKAGA